MKKLAKALSLALLLSITCLACESLTTDLDELTPGNTDLVIQNTGGGEDDGEDFPKSGE